MPHAIEFLGFTILRGPNMWSYQPAVEALVDIGDLEDYPSDRLPGLPDRLEAWLPGLVEHRCSYGERGGFLRRLREGTWPGHILEHVTLELMSQAGMPDGFGRARETSRRSLYKVVVTMWHEAVTLRALHLARDLLMAAIENRPFDAGQAIAELTEAADEHLLGPSTAAIVAAAEARKIPFVRLNAGNLVQLGYGARQRRIWTAETEATSAIAEGISRDKPLTKRLLAACGVPVPEGRRVDDAADAWAAAEDIGGPVAVKPVDGNHGRGVFVNLSTREQVEAAFAVAAQEGSAVLVERFIPGNEHRLLVVGGRMVAAAFGEAISVTGDGEHTVAELVELQVNSDPRRGDTEAAPLNFIRIDSGAVLELQQQGLSAEAVPAAGREVVIQRMGNVSIDITDRVHPKVAAAAALAARIVGLDIAGVDLVTRDIGRPLAETGGAIVEVNAGPGLLMHLRPSAGQPRPVGPAIVDQLFPGDDAGRIPIVGVSGTGANAPIARLVAHLLQFGGRRTGLATRDGLWLDRRQVRSGDCTAWTCTNQVLTNRTVETAVFEHDMRRLATEGIAYDRCQVGIVTGLDPALRFPDLWLDDADLMFRVLRTQVDIVLAGGAAVLDAHDDAVADMGRLCDGDVILYGHDASRPALADHLARGGRAVLLRDGGVALAIGSGDLTTLSLPEADRDTVARFWLPAIAAAWAMDLPLETIETGIAAFEPDTTAALAAVR